MQENIQYVLQKYLTFKEPENDYLRGKENQQISTQNDTDVGLNQTKMLRSYYNYVLCGKDKHSLMSGKILIHNRKIKAV